MTSLSAPRSAITSLTQDIYASLNWFRIHLLVFTFLPLLFSGFFSAANPSQASAARDGDFITQYIDSLFMCFSAMTGTGISTISVSPLSTPQQAFLFVLIILGDMSVVNLITLLCRIVWWRQSCPEVVHSKLLEDLYTHRGHPEEARLEAGPDSLDSGTASRNGDKRWKERLDPHTSGAHGEERRLSQPKSQQPVRDTHSADSAAATGRRERAKATHSGTGFSSSNDDQHVRLRHGGAIKKGKDPHASVAHASSGRKRHSGRGGFPGAHQILPDLIRLISPRSHSYLSGLLRQGKDDGHLARDITRAVKKPFKDQQEESRNRHALAVGWLPKAIRDVVTNDSSQFFEEELEARELEILGSMEYRATKLMAGILFAHIFFWIMVPSAMIAIYFARVHFWDTKFQINGSIQTGNVHTTWFAFFQGASAYASCGLSLVDELMIPFQNCFFLIYVLIAVMLAGNQVLPVFLRFEIWLLSKVVKEGSELYVLLHFILTHGRRVCLYIFPRYQSWWLFAIEIFLWNIGTAALIVFNQDLGYYDTLGEPFQRFSVALFQSLCARATGFDIVQLAYLAPATPFLYLMLIFTSNYSMVMAIRSTNVYEERALGLNGEHAPGKHNEKANQGGKGHIYAKYLTEHLLPQIYFDLWPVFVGTLLILIIERTNLVDPNNVGWLGVFQIFYEVISGYANVGLSYSNPFNTSSLTSAFRNLSKFIMILLMLRGRHRGLPLAIDRATMFPVEYKRLSHGDREQVEEDRVNEAGHQAEDD